MTELLYLNTSSFTAEAYSRIMGVLPPERQKKAEGYAFINDRYLSAGAGYLLFVALKERGMEYFQKNIVFGENGKPYLKGNDAYFSLSHSGSIAVCAVGDCENGADVQQIRPINEKIIARVLSENEAAIYSSLPPQRRNDFFFSAWSKKESILKYLGKGLSLPLKMVETCGEITVCGQRKDVFLKEYFLDGYKAFVCSQKNEFSSEMRLIRVE